MHEQVVTLVAATRKVFLGINRKEIKSFQHELLNYVTENYPDIPEELEREKALSAELMDRIAAAAEEYKSRC